MKQAVVALQNLVLQAGGELPIYGVDGDLGNETRTAIDTLALPKYVKIALKEVGIKEFSGSADNPDVVKYHKTTAGKYSDDEIPWCGSFINWVMLKAGYPITVPVPERAKSWLNFGEEIDEPVVGAIAVKSRKGGGHVCIVVGKTHGGKLLCIGGNQSDEVNLRAYYPEIFEGFRIPLDSTKDELQMYTINYNTDSYEA